MSLTLALLKLSFFCTRTELKGKTAIWHEHHHIDSITLGVVMNLPRSWSPSLWSACLCAIRKKPSWAAVPHHHAPILFPFRHDREFQMLGALVDMFHFLIFSYTTINQSGQNPISCEIIISNGSTFYFVPRLSLNVLGSKNKVSCQVVIG